MVRRSALALLAMLALAVSCESSVDRSLDGLRCNSERACVVGYECRAGECVRPDAEPAPLADADVTRAPDAAMSALAESSSSAGLDAALSGEASAVGETSLPLTSEYGQVDAAPTSPRETAAETTDVVVTTTTQDDTVDVCVGTCTASVCDGGACLASCRAGEERCDGQCVDTTSDADNCGRCGQACVPPSNATTRCVESRCAISCYVGFDACSGVCIDTRTDRLNCGNCGVECKGNRACIDGVCTK